MPRRLSNRPQKTRMKLPHCDPVTINDRPFTVADMVSHVTTKERRYNATAEDARRGKRTRDAVSAGTDILPDDLKKLADVLDKPSCGWGEFVVVRKIPRPDGTFVEMPQRAQFPTHLFLPLIDLVQRAAASVS